MNTSHNWIINKIIKKQIPLTLIVAMCSLPLAAQAACNTSISNSAELHASITNPDCEGMTLNLSAGTFKPEVLLNPSDPRSATFQITIKDITIRGSGEDKTILSGDIGVAGDPSDNAYNIIRPFKTPPPDYSYSFEKIKLEKLTLAHGQADDFNTFNIYGSAIYIEGFLPSGAVLHLDKVTVRDNYGAGSGAVEFWNPLEFFTGSFPAGYELPQLIIEHSKFVNNTAGGDPELNDGVTFIGGAGGAGEMLAARVFISHSYFDNNMAGFSGGAFDFIDSILSIKHNEFVNGKVTATSGAFRTLRWSPAVTGDDIIEHNVFRNNRVVGLDPRGPTYQRAGATIVEGVKDSNSKVVFRSNVYDSNSSVGETGALDILNANIDLIGNIFKNNHSAGNGGAVLIVTTPPEFRDGTYGMQVLIKNNMFDNNEAKRGGGAIGIQETFSQPAPFQSRFEIVDNSFTNNRAYEIGGALALGAKDVLVSKNLFINNRAAGISSVDGDPSGRGGAVTVVSIARTQGPFQFVAPIINAGPLEDLVANAIIEDSVFIGNSALHDGGAISDDLHRNGYNYEPGFLGAGESISYSGPGLANISISNSLFKFNSADEGNGGAIGMTATGQPASYILAPFSPLPWSPDPSAAIIPSNLSLSNSLIMQNSAGGSGGGVFIYSDTVQSLMNNLIKLNVNGDCDSCN